jgi:hypothetical protein
MLWKYVTMGLFLVVIVALNFHFDFEDSILDPWAFGELRGIPGYTLYYAIPYYLAALIVLAFEKKLEIMKSWQFWIKSMGFFLIAGFGEAFYWHLELLESYTGPGESYFLFKVVNNLIRLLLYVVPMLIIKYYFDRKEKGLFGLRFDYFNYKPYAFMLLIMVPLIIWASFQPSFQSNYPRISPWLIDGVFGLSQWQIIAIFEISYGINFTFIELMYRGALVVGMVSILGRNAVIPMITVYCVLHFGKPMGEAIGSIFGGYMLGIIAYYTRNIFGGVIIHIGVAYLMEIAAFIQHYLK